VQLGDDVGDRLADARQLAQPVLGDDAVERLDQGGERVRGALVGFRAEIIVAGERGAPAELDQQRCDPDASSAAISAPLRQPALLGSSSTPPSNR
jgi:hypothetical protein